ncbi:MAG: protein-methionine-sulfoxide reductase catalytic subunit MsrP [Dokdonella sp.]
MPLEEASMRRFKPPAIPMSQITDEAIYLRRREIIKGVALAGAGMLIGCERHADADAAQAPELPGKPLVARKPSPFDTNEPQTSFRDATHYNNYYEFGTEKGDPARESSAFKAEPWSVTIAGHAEVTGKFSLEDILKPHPLEERIYRMRCVEAWSMVIPWVGFPLADLIKRLKPSSQAKYVAFTTVNRPSQMPGLSYPVLDWPYREGLRIDEAMNPLALLVVGLYGRTAEAQNGAPLRLIVPWKYGFKGCKSIVRIEFTEQQPSTSWNASAPEEYGFYANVNPQVDHPRWTQASERRISGSGFDLLGNRIETKMFNGYAEQVAGLYTSMDLRRNF